ncbi:glycosylhydrolase-like jelly roll fold domain-containing protein [Companilactobacillus sp. HBUAS56257]|uniref:glycosylhydrolase-like jelly roll fold domain-containing protein n=1 Tax=Companilactobacillus sp. HBUAS56257 TaxID=3109360 RepID=UPI002FF37101
MKEVGGKTAVNYNNGKVHLRLAAGQSVIFVASDAYYPVKADYETTNKIKLNLKNIKLSVANAESYPKFESKQILNKLINVNSVKNFRQFSGNIKYSMQFDLDQVQEGMILDLGKVNEVATVELNGHKLGTKIAYPYEFKDISSYLVAGTNNLEVVVVNNLGINQQDFLSQYMLIKPAGLLGPISLKY